MGVRLDWNGRRIRSKVDEKIYIVIDGLRHWVPNPATYENLFRDWDGVEDIIDIDSIDAGADITDGAILARGGEDPPVYLISNGVKRHVTSPEAMDRYYFEWDRVISLPPVAVLFIPTGTEIS